MKVVTWNCNGAFRKKFHEISSLDADIYIIQECEDPAHSSGEYKIWSENSCWHGTTKHKGLGVFAKNGAKIQLLEWQDNGLQLFLPIQINSRINLIAVWTKEANSPTFRYIGQLWKYLELHKEKMASSSTVLCGDLNSNKIWDVWDRWWNHSDVVRELENVGMYSLYHQATGENQGEESKPTFFHYRKREKAYHIDFAFASRELFNPAVNTVLIGEPERWLELSDHVPVQFTIAS